MLRSLPVLFKVALPIYAQLLSRLYCCRYDKQVVGRYKVPAGTYTIIPTTYYPKATGEFFLRVWHYEEDKDTVSLTLLPSAEGSSLHSS